VTLNDRERKVRVSSKADPSIRSPNQRKKDNPGQNKACNPHSARKNRITKHNPSGLPFPLLEARAKARRKVFISPTVSIVPKRKWQTTSDPSINTASRVGMGPYPARIRGKEIKRA
jgi:hypothetical protein